MTAQGGRKSTGQGVRRPELWSALATHQLCDLERVIPLPGPQFPHLQMASQALTETPGVESCGKQSAEFRLHTDSSAPAWSASGSESLSPLEQAFPGQRTQNQILPGQHQQALLGAAPQASPGQWFPHLDILPPLLVLLQDSAGVQGGLRDLC